jgi:PAS domain S-box-containing protein
MRRVSWGAETETIPWRKPIDIGALRLLLVEDDEDDYVIIRDMLADVVGDGFHMDWAATYSEALEAVNERTYDICLLDYYLGRHTGLELLHAFLQDNYDGPVIMLTGLGDQTVDLKAMEAGASDYLIKGEINPYLLERTIRYSVRHWRVLRELQRREDRFRSLVQNSSDVIAVLKADGAVRYVSDSCERILGYSPDDLIDTYAQDFVHPDDLPSVEAAFSELADSPADTLAVEFRFLHHDGAWRILEATASNLLDHASVAGIVTNARDVTAQRQAEQKVERYAAQLERSNRDLENFAYVISHDLREPLRMVTSFLRLLERRYEDALDAEGRSFIDYAVEGAARMRAMIDALLDLSRVKTRGRPFEPVDTGALLLRTLRVLERVIEESGAEVTHDPLPTVRGDAAQLGQVFQNLIANAVKFQREGAAPRIHVSATGPRARRPISPPTDSPPCSGQIVRGGDDVVSPEQWVFSVRDNGIGIDPNQADRIFEVFQRLHTEEEYPGLGIGLALCKRIIERHGGRIWAETAQDGGSLFCFTLPVDPARAED